MTIKAKFARMDKDKRRQTVNAVVRQIRKQQVLLKVGEAGMKGEINQQEPSRATKLRTANKEDTR